MQKITMKAQNIILSSRTGAGNTELDRGAGQTSNWATTNPFHRTDYFNRWRELINWYYTSWMARKGVDIPVEDAMRGGFQIRKIDPTVSKRLKRRFDQLKVTDKLERACKQERLLGGCALLIVVRDSRAGDSTARMSDPLNLKLISKNPGAIMALNMADIYRIALPQQNNDLFDPTFDDPRSYLIDGVEVDKSRLVVFDGKPLFGRVSYNIMFPVPRVNPGGFGESILTPVYEDLLRANGTAQAAYHLVNMASVLLVLMQEYTGLQSSKAGEQKIVEMERIVNSISLYKGAILDGVGVDVKSLPASFGGVPDLVKQFVANLAAAWDIPMTRFLGMSPGGMNSTGQSDLENYYNMVQSYRERQLVPAIKDVVRLLAIEEFGIDGGNQIHDEMEVEYKPLWNLDTKTEAEAAKTWLDGMMPLLDRGCISSDDFALEAKKRNIILLPDTKIVDPEPMMGAMDGDSPFKKAMKDEKSGSEKKDSAKREKTA